MGASMVIGAAGRNRTRDLCRTKGLLFQMSYCGMQHGPEPMRALSASRQGRKK